MAPEQRRDLGINKSALWYIQKDLYEGKKIKIYEMVRLKPHDVFVILACVIAKIYHL